MGLLLLLLLILLSLLYYDYINQFMLDLQYLFLYLQCPQLANGVVIIIIVINIIIIVIL